MAASTNLDIFMIVAVNDFNYGRHGETRAFNISTPVVYWRMPDTLTTDLAFQRQSEAVVAHEYFLTGQANRRDLS